ncbi:MAG: nucleotidyltransferase domain-containing protein [Candidatus Uhrbacteria bacterium]|nr:nucleotidyltransferase domain-containing protein [Candidatus Uhrbacteria bacterium]
MKKVIEAFLKELKSSKDTKGVLLFGSYTRGDQRPTSDVDVLVITKEGAWRDIEERDGQMFEIVYASLELAKDFYKKNPNDAVQQWTDGKIIHDPEGVMEELKRFVFEIRDKGREAMTEKQVNHIKFEKEDKVRAVEYLQNTDLATATLYLQALCQELVELFFELNQQWTPAPKQRLPYMRKSNHEVANVFNNLFTAENFKQQLEETKKVLALLFVKQF